jgi:hypothetical protein
VKYSIEIFLVFYISFLLWRLALHQFFTSGFTSASLRRERQPGLARDQPARPAKELEMKSRYGCWTAGITVALVALCCAPAALANCGGLQTPKVHPSAWQPGTGQGRLLRVAGEDLDQLTSPPIVGMWHVVFTADTSNGASISNMVVDNALVVWHSDGTEIMNSVRPPQDGNFCMGVWEQTGRFTYKLNHFAWFANAYPTNPPTEIGPPTGPTRITEKVILSPDARSFTGSFTLDAYDPTGTIVVQSFTGAIAGTRITVTTTIGDLL